MRNKILETVALATITGGLAYYLRSEMSDLAGVILDGPRSVWAIVTGYGLTDQPTIWQDILFNNGAWWLAGLAMFWLVALVTWQVVRLVYTVGRECVARRAAVEFPDWLPGNR
jgi:hypothetical protein